MASGPITSWQIEGEKVKALADFLFLVSKIITDGDCSHAIKRHLLLGRKVITNLDIILKSRDITLLTKVLTVKLMIFLVVMNGSESCTIKKTECWRINAFELWCWRRLLRVICTARRSNQLILKEINPECSLEGLMLKLKTPMSQLFTSGGRHIGASASASDLPMNIQGWFSLGFTGLISLQSMGLPRVFSSTAIWKHQFFGAQPSLWTNIHSWLLEKSLIWL